MRNLNCSHMWTVTIKYYDSNVPLTSVHGGESPGVVMRKLDEMGYCKGRDLRYKVKIVPRPYKNVL